MTQNSNLNISWLSKIAVVAVGVILVLPLGLVQAQDFGRVQKRLDKMVNKDLITGEQADAMMIALKETANKGHDHAEKPMSEADMKEMAEKIEAAAESGVITRAQARKKHEHLRREFAKSHSEHAKKGEEEMTHLKERYAAGAKKIKAAVEAGKVSEADANKRLGEMREHMFGEKSKRDRDGDGENGAEGDNTEGVMRRLRMAVESGKITREEAGQRARQYKARLRDSEGDGDRDREEGAGDKGAKAGNTEGVMRRLRMAVESGRITEEQASERARQYKMRLMEERYKAAASVVNEAVDAGIFSVEEGEERLILMRKAMFGVYENRAENQGEIQEKLRAHGMKLRKGVTAGKLTESEARKEFESFRKELTENAEGSGHDKDERHERDHDDSRGHDNAR